MAHVYAQTRDPLYLAVPSQLADAGYGANAGPIFGTRSTGLVYNYLPWLLAALQKNRGPTPDSQLEVRITGTPIMIAPGQTMRIRFAVKNNGTEAIEGLRVSFHSRLDVHIAALESPPERLAAGQEVECGYEVRAPAQINLSCEYNRVAFAHWSALYRRGERTHLAHLPTKFVLK
jgi:hypothetical protein